MTWIWLCRGAMGLRLFRRLVRTCQHYALSVLLEGVLPELVLVRKHLLVFLPSQFCFPFLGRRER
jgi:hypothetical protein